MPSGYSKEAEKVLADAALALSKEDFDSQKAKELHYRLGRVLSETDPFWLRWRFVGEKKGWLS